MKTPAGTECKYFYGDYYRGREHEECRLLDAAWTRDLCRTCPVPSIGRANACEFMQLRGEVTRPLAAAFRRRVKVTAFCEKTQRSGFDPHIGCGECHPLPPVFEEKK
ncbi:MAG: hypothetical protein IMZ73_11140 [Chloroflexi bacterium]|nr:hypothetical protein [Chloroflexota bacterium]